MTNIALIVQNRVLGIIFTYEKQYRYFNIAISIDNTVALLIV